MRRIVVGAIGCAAYLAVPQAVFALDSWMRDGRPVRISSAVREVVGDEVQGVNTGPWRG